MKNSLLAQVYPLLLNPRKDILKPFILHQTRLKKIVFYFFLLTEGNIHPLLDSYLQNGRMGFPISSKNYHV